MKISIHEEYIDAIHVLPREEQGVLMLAITEYMFYGEEPEELSDNAMAIFRLIVKKADSRRSQKERVEKHAEKANKTAEENNAENSVKNNEENCVKKSVKNAVNINAEISVKNSENQEKKKKSPPCNPPKKEKKNELLNNNIIKLNHDPFAEFADGDSALIDALEAFRRHRKAIKAPLTPDAERLTIRSLEKLSGGDRALMVAILEQSITRGWRGIFAIDERQKVTPPLRNPSENKYDEMRRLNQAALMQLAEDG